MGTSGFTAWGQKVEASPVQAAWPSLMCHLNCLSGICLHKVLASASREINPNISTIVSQYIKEAKKSSQNKVLRVVKAQICRVQSPFPNDSTPTTRAYKQKLLLTPASEQKPSSQVVATRMDLSGATPAGLSSCLLSLRTWKKHGHGRPTLQPSPSTGGNSPGTTQSNWEPEKTSEKGEEGCRALLNRQGETGCNGLREWSQSWGLFRHPLLAVTLGCPQEPSHHCPRSPSAPVSQLSNTILLIPCGNQCDEIQHSPTKCLNQAQGCSEKAVFFYYQINVKKPHPFHFPHQRS